MSSGREERIMAMIMTKRRPAAYAFLAGLLWASTAFGWSFGVCGDSRDDTHGVFPLILAAVRDSDMEFLLHTGDLEDTGGEASWNVFRRRTAGFPKPLYVVYGNHEIRGGTREGFAAFFDLPGTNYSFTHRDARFVILDDANGSLPASTLAWLAGELAAHPKGKDGIAFLVVAMHVPPRTETIFPHGTKPGFVEQSDELYRLLLRYKADLVLCSHEHLHRVADWEGIRVIVSGGAGAPLYPFNRYGFYRVDLDGKEVREKFLPIEPEKR